jgi:hypothetical protein
MADCETITLLDVARCALVVWHDLRALTSRFPRPPEELMTELNGQPKWLRPGRLRR